MKELEELVTCEICVFKYDGDQRVPKFLDCFHSFCADCLRRIHETSRGIECPICRTVTPGSGPHVLKTNFYVTRLMAYVDTTARGAVSNSGTPPRPTASEPTQNPSRTARGTRAGSGSKWAFNRLLEADEGVSQVYAGRSTAAKGHWTSLSENGVRFHLNSAAARPERAAEARDVYDFNLRSATGRSYAPASTAVSPKVEDQAVNDSYLKRFCTSALRQRLDAGTQCHVCLEFVGGTCSHCGPSSKCPLVQLNNCFHVFHEHCLTKFLGNDRPDYFECPLCETLQGKKTGNQPTTGSMTVERSRKPLPGFPNCGRIVIKYHFVPGTQDNRGPHPGGPFEAPNFPKKAFLPDNEEGNQVLRLFQEAWNRRLLFQIISRNGRDLVTFGPVTQKIHDFPDSDGFGYPDDNYLNLVRMELNTLGIVN